MSGTKYFLMVLFCALTVCGLTQAKFSVDNAVHKFPKTKEGTLLKHVFKVTNTGDAPLIISDYKVACTCTKLTLPERPIAPGETVGLEVTFDTKGKYYFQDRIIYLQTNTKSKEEKLRIKVNVE